MAKVKINVKKGAKIEYLAPTVGQNIVPAMRTPDDSFPLVVEVLKTELDDSGQVTLATDDKTGGLIVVKTLVERVIPEGKQTLCGLESAYHPTWALTLCHGIVAYFQGCNVKGRVYASTFSHNFNRVDDNGETVLDIAKLFDSGFVLRITMEVGRSLPPTMGSEHSVWIVPIAAIRDYTLTLANSVALTDSMTKQTAPVKAAKEKDLEEFEFEL